MAPRTRMKSNTGKRIQAQVTDFGQLETTPTNPHHHPLILLSQADADQPVSTDHPNLVDMLDHELADTEMLRLDYRTAKETQSKTFAWSEAGSFTRRSSPVRSEEAPADDIWEFDDNESLAPLSSPQSGKNQLPDTMPLPPEHQVGDHQAYRTGRRIDFSETASTARRSSPFGLGDVRKEIWDFHKSPSAAALSTKQPDDPSPHTKSVPKTASSPHLPMMELYEATPQAKTHEHIEVSPPIHQTEPSSVLKKRNPPIVTNTQKEVDAASSVKLKQSTQGYEQQQCTPLKRQIIMAGDQGSNSVEASSSNRKRNRTESVYSQPKPALYDPTYLPSSSTEKQKTKKRKQRAKEPVQFDDITHEVKKDVIPIKYNTETKPAIVSSVQEPAKSPTLKGKPTRKRPATKQARSRRNAKSTNKAPLEEKTPKFNPLNIEDTNRCLAPTKLPTKREVEASQQSKLTPCLGKGTGKEELSAGVEHMIVVSSDNLSGVDLNDSPFCPSSALQPIQQEKSQQPQPIQRYNLGKIEVSKDAEIESSGTLIDFNGMSSIKLNAVAPLISVEEICHSATEDGDDQRPKKRAPREAFINRDLNVRIDRPPSPKRTRSHGNLRTEELGRSITKETSHRRPQELARKASRQFSVSERGSPVPVKQSDFSLMTSVEENALGANVIGFHRADQRGQRTSFISRSANYAPVPESPNRLKSSSGSRNTATVKNRTTHNLRGNGYNHYSTLAGETHHQGCPESPRLHQNGVKNDDLRAQILNSLLEKADQSINDGQKDAKHSCQPGIGSLTTRGSNLSKLLHQVIDQLTNHLETKEASAYKVAQTYRKSGVECVARLQRRCLEERDSIAETYNKHIVQFGKKSQRAKTALETSGRNRGKLVADLEESMRQRQIMYQRVSTSLRALHGQLINGLEVRWGNREQG